MRNCISPYHKERRIDIDTMEVDVGRVLTRIVHTPDSYGATVEHKIEIMETYTLKQSRWGPMSWWERVS